MLLNIYYSLATFGNTPKVDIKTTMNEKKNQLIMMYNASTFKRKRKKKDIKLRGIQVVLYLDQRGHVKQKSDDFSSN